MQECEIVNAFEKHMCPRCPNPGQTSVSEVRERLGLEGSVVGGAGALRAKGCPVPPSLPLRGGTQGAADVKIRQCRLHMSAIPCVYVIPRSFRKAGALCPWGPHSPTVMPAPT